MNSDWEVEKYVSIRFDISMQKAAEGELQRASLMLEEAQAVARIGSWSFDLATGHVQWSKQIYALFGRDESLGPPDFPTAMSYYAEEDRSALQEAVAHTAATGEPYSLVLRTQSGHDGVRFLRGIGQARTDSAGVVTGMFGTVADVTAEIERGDALKRAQREAEAAGARLQEMNTFLEGETVRANEMAARAELASQTKSEFLANMSHEIRTPLTAILGYTDLLAEELVVDDESTRRASTLQTIRRAGEHLLTVINDVLDLSKIESGKLIVERVETDLPRIMLDVDSLMRSRSAAKGVELYSGLTSAVPTRIWSDPTRLRQILLNLVGNAAKFTAEGRIDVTAAVVQVEHRDAPLLRVEVRDTGPGMTSAQSTKLFQPFQQGDASVTREHGGTGLGLTICRRLARAMGGDVRLESSEPGRGSCFVLELPMETQGDVQLIHHLTEITSAVTPATLTVVTGAPTSLHGRILLAEDGEDNQRLISFHLERAGAQVTIVGNGQLALDAIDAADAAGEPFGLVITDMQMPVMDGYTLARTLRACQFTTPVIALTAHAMAEDRQRCIDAGCDDYATKPIDKKVLVATCIRWMGVSREAPTRTEVVTSATHDAARVAYDDGVSGGGGVNVRGANVADIEVVPSADDAVLISELLDDPDMLPLVQGFLVLLAERITLIEQQREIGQRAELASLAHQLKGAAGGYGYPTITEAARTLERYASAGGTQREVDDAIAALAATCRAAVRGGGAVVPVANAIAGNGTVTAIRKQS
jgi:signal transduction histidine kinase/CheY-like chemotaxis protein